jgi:DNA-binding MltR family transcriptional regulator
MRKEPKILGFDEFADELQAERNPRSLIILASAKLDTQLGAILEAFFRVKAKPKEPDELLEGDGPLTSYSSRIKICQRLGLIAPSLAKALDKLRDIRNQAAHWISFLPVDSPVRDQFSHLRNIIEKRKSYALTVDRFWGTPLIHEELQRMQAVPLTMCVLLESVSTKVKRFGGIPEFISATND